MAWERQYKLRVPAVILGLPLDKSENPVLSTIVGEASASVAIEECDEPEVEVLSPEQVRGAVEGFVSGLVREMGLDVCVRARIASNGQPSAGLYASATATLFLAVSDFYGESPEPYEIIEYARLLEPFEQASSWQTVIDALRYNSIVGGTTVYRNDEEYARVGEATLTRRARLITEVSVGPQTLGDRELGPDVYGAFIHTIGVAVLEGVVRVREAGAVDAQSLGPLIRVQNSLADLFWEVKAKHEPGPGILISPGLPGTFALLSL